MVSGKGEEDIFNFSLPDLRLIPFNDLFSCMSYKVHSRLAWVYLYTMYKAQIILVRAHAQLCYQWVIIINQRSLVITALNYFFIGFIYFYWLSLEREKKGEREKHQFVVPLIHAFTGGFLYVPCPGIKPTTLVYGDDALTNWATRPWPAALN